MSEQNVLAEIWRWEIHSWLPWSKSLHFPTSISGRGISHLAVLFRTMDSTPDPPSHTHQASECQARWLAPWPTEGTVLLPHPWEPTIWFQGEDLHQRKPIHTVPGVHSYCKRTLPANVALNFHSCIWLLLNSCCVPGSAPDTKEEDYKWIKMVLVLEKLGASGGDWKPVIIRQISKMLANSSH